MKKIKVFSYRDTDLVEIYVNEFIAHHNVTDIQFRAFQVFNSEHYAVMIVYEED